MMLNDIILYAKHMSKRRNLFFKHLETVWFLEESLIFSYTIPQHTMPFGLIGGWLIKVKGQKGLLLKESREYTCV